MGSTVLLLETGESVEQGGQLLRVDGQQEEVLRAGGQLLRVGGQQGGGGGGRQQQRWRLQTHLHPQTWWKADLGHIPGRRHKLSRGWPCEVKKYNLSSISMMRRKFCKIFYYLTAGHLLESKSLTEVLMCVMILLICSSFNLFTLELDVHHDGLDLIFLLPARNSTFFKLSILKQLVPPPLCCSHFPSTCCRRSEKFY